MCKSAITFSQRGGYNLIDLPPGAPGFILTSTQLQPATVFFVTRFLSTTVAFALFACNGDNNSNKNNRDGSSSTSSGDNEDNALSDRSSMSSAILE